MDPDPFDNPGPVCLRGSLILADPSLRDPNFVRTVLLLTDHEIEQGAHGYVLNRPMGRTVGEVLPNLQCETLGSIPVFVGGPVGQERLTFASMSWDPEEKRLIFTTHLSVDDALKLQRAGGHLRAFVGYSGWSEGQLESELRQRAWITRKPAPEVVEMKSPGTLWNELLASMGPWFGLLSRMPDDPSMN